MKYLNKLERSDLQVQVMKIKDCVPIENLIGLGFEECKYEIDRKWVNLKYVSVYQTYYRYKIGDSDVSIEFYPESRILYISTMDQCNVILPNVIYFMIKNGMIELTEVRSEYDVR